MARSENWPRVAPSHGGWFFDRLTGDLTVYLKDMTEGAAAKRALPALLAHGLASARARHPHAGIVFKQGSYTFTELARWRDTLDEFLGPPSVQLWGIDFAKNQIMIGVLAGTDTEPIAALARDLGIPAGALRFERAGRVRAEKTLQDSIRPVEGGITIERPLPPDSLLDCTLGFPALWGGEHAFVTASHCSSQEWVLDSTKWYQNRAPLTHPEAGGRLWIKRSRTTDTARATARTRAPGYHRGHGHDSHTWRDSYGKRDPSRYHVRYF